MLTTWACLCAGDILLRREGAEGAFSLPTGTQPPVELRPWQVVTTIPIAEGLLKVVKLDQPVTNVPELEMMALRKSHAFLSASHYQLAGKASELIYWDANTKFCGCCGTPSKWMTPISKQCPQCGKEWWPSVATAVIVRIIKRDAQGEAILLVRAHTFRTNHYGLVAGFLETGESLEEAVKREVREETGVSIRNLRYFGSQPWPFPFGLMVGFTAEYAGGELHLQKEELSKGGWFTRKTMPPIPDKASIARQLIDDWLLHEEQHQPPAIDE